MKPIKKVIKLSYNATATVFCGPFEWFAKRASKYTDSDLSDLEGSAGLCLEIVDNSGVKQWLLWAEEGDFETIVHESVHAAVLILSDRNVPMNPNGNSESLAYLVGEISSKWLKISHNPAKDK